MHQKKALKQSLTASLEINNADNIGHKDSPGSSRD